MTPPPSGSASSEPQPDSLHRHTDYGHRSLDEADLDPDPLKHFRGWLEEAECAGIYEPNAMVVGTVDPDGAPSSRTVLLKGLFDGDADAPGFQFVTNYGSRKALALASHPAVTLLFPWYSMQRQVIVAGRAARTSPATSDAYFADRPRGSQLASAASDQSRPIGSREELDARVEELGARHPASAPVDRPEDWGAYHVTPTRIEFWQGRTSRLHDRLVYTLAGGGWSVQRLQP